ncbi:hypothetical protein Hanom_Chr13g01227891 [Helianthus anomalus]
MHSRFLELSSKTNSLIFSAFQLEELQTTSSVADMKTDEISLQTVYVYKNKQHLNQTTKTSTHSYIHMIT